MAKKETESDDRDEQPSSKALTAEQVQRMIEAAFVRYDVIHGHLSPGDAEALLADLTK